MKYFKLTFLFALAAASCDIKNSDAPADKNYSRIYEYADINLDFYPVDAKETADQDFIILSAIKESDPSTLFPAVHILKIDNEGNVLWDYSSLEEGHKKYLSPLPDLIEMNGKLHFVAMEDDTKSYLLQIDENAYQMPIVELGSLALNKALNAFKSSQNEILIQYHNHNSNKIIIERYNTSLGLINSHEVNCGEIDGIIDRHLDRSGKQYPFFIRDDVQPDGANGYVINTFSDFTLSLMFLDASSNSFSGMIQGQRESGGISSALPITDEAFFLSRFHDEKSYVHSQIAIDRSSYTNASKDLDKSYFPEIDASKPSKLIKEEFHSKELAVYAASGHNNQILVYFFDASSGELLATKYLGHTNPVELSSILKTSDGGLAVVGKTWVAGRYQRIVFFKLSPESIPS